MIIYFDESYDRRHRYLLLGALFLPSTYLANHQLSKIKESRRGKAPGHTFAELKYSRSGDRYTSAACCDAVDLFVRGRSYFRCIVIDTALDNFSWDYFGSPTTSPALKRAFAYNKFAELLLRYNLSGIQNAVLLADSLTRTPGDNFVQFITSVFGTTMIPPDLELKPAQIHHVQPVDTHLPQYQLGQICDILLGVVLGDLVPPTNPNKLALINHVKEAVKIESFKPEFWLRHPKHLIDVIYPKLQVWHWRPHP